MLGGEGFARLYGLRRHSHDLYRNSVHTPVTLQVKLRGEARAYDAYTNRIGHSASSESLGMTLSFGLDDQTERSGFYHHRNVSAFWRCPSNVETVPTSLPEDLFRPGCGWVDFETWAECSLI